MSKRITHYVRRKNNHELLGWFENEKEAAKFARKKNGEVCKCDPFNTDKNDKKGIFAK